LGRALPAREERRRDLRGSASCLCPKSEERERDDFKMNVEREKGWRGLVVDLVRCGVGQVGGGGLVEPGIGAVWARASTN
jgi:hypothetical protein